LFNKVLKYYFVASVLDILGISSQNAMKPPNHVFNREQVFNSEAQNLFSNPDLDGFFYNIRTLIE